MSLLAIRNTTTGMPMVPMTPIGSRTKILISSQVSFRSARILFTDRMPRERQKHVFEIRELGLETRHLNAMFGQALNDVRDQVAAASANRALTVLPGHRLDAGNRLEVSRRGGIRRFEHHGFVLAMPSHEAS